MNSADSATMDKDAPFLSVIVPIFQVENYLEECLDSILNQTFSDFELIAVDDCSPDGSARILDEYAAKDSRVRVVSLEQNVGLGRARNAGLERARGEYVWFVDSDDSITPGSMAAIADRLVAVDADVVLFDWTRFYEDGRIVPSTAGKVLNAAPDVFSLDEWPDAVRIMPFAWNKAIRRDLLSRLGLRFEAGWYEDTSFTYPLLAVAERITTLPKACVMYRKRPASITATVSERHFEIFDHWERAFLLLDAYVGRSSLASSMIFTKMIHSYLYMLLRSNRVPAELRKRFCRNMQHHYRRFYPSGGARRKRRSGGLKERLVGLGYLPLLDLMGAATRFKDVCAQRVRGGFRKLSSR